MSTFPILSDCISNLEFFVIFVQNTWLTVSYTDAARLHLPYAPFINEISGMFRFTQFLSTLRSIASPITNFLPCVVSRNVLRNFMERIYFCRLVRLGIAQETTVVVFPEVEFRHETGTDKLFPVFRCDYSVGLIAIPCMPVTSLTFYLWRPQEKDTRNQEQFVVLVVGLPVIFFRFHMYTSCGAIFLVGMFCIPGHHFCNDFIIYESR